MEMIPIASPLLDRGMYTAKSRHRRNEASSVYDPHEGYGTGGHCMTVRDKRRCHDADPRHENLLRVLRVQVRAQQGLQDNTRDRVGAKKKTMPPRVDPDASQVRLELKKEGHHGRHEGEDHTEEHKTPGEQGGFGRPRHLSFPAPSRRMIRLPATCLRYSIDARISLMGLTPSRTIAAALSSTGLFRVFPAKVSSRIRDVKTHLLKMVEIEALLLSDHDGAEDLALFTLRSSGPGDKSTDRHPPGPLEGSQFHPGIQDIQRRQCVARR